MSAFDRAHMISYSSLIETMRLFCTVFEIRRVRPILSKFTNFGLPHLHLAPRSWLPRSHFESFGMKKLESMDYRRCLRVPMFSHFSRTPTCDRQTQRHRAMAHTAQSIAGAIKTGRNFLGFSPQGIVNKPIWAKFCKSV